MKDWLKSGYFWIAFGAFITSIIVIAIFPFLFESFESWMVRLFVAFFIIFGTIIGMLVFKLTLKEETQKKMQQRKAQKERLKSHAGAVSEKVKDLKARFVEAMKIIKNASIYDNRKNSNSDLPWYLLVGKRQEGKTEILENSGLDFPLNINYDKRMVHDGESTKSFQWYFAEHAIFVDMPGNYIEQKESPTDEHLWHSFLKLFRFRKWTRPINGVILTLSYDTLMGMQEGELEAYGKSLRDRFEELSKALGANIPIYLLVTKCDKIDGFNEYFANISNEEHREILGITFENEIDSVDKEVLEPEFEKLLNRLNSSVLDKVHQELDPMLRTKTLLFPDAFTTTFDRLKMFIETAFAKTRYRAPLHLRGIYFTSVAREEQLGYEYEDATRNQKKKGMFIFKVLHDIIFPEADIIKTDTTYKQKLKRRQIAIFASAIFMVFTFSIYWITEFNSRSNTLDSLEKQLTAYKELRQSIDMSTDFEEALGTLNHIYEMLQTSGDDMNLELWRPAYFKVDNRNAMLTQLYREALEHVLLPRIAKHIQSNMLANLTSHESTWDSTKAYLMLRNEDRRDPEFLRGWMENFWSSMYANKIEVQQDLNKHWKNLIAYGFIPVELHEATLRTARAKLRGFGHDALIYKQLKESVAEENIKDFQFSKVMGSHVATFNGNEYVIPGFFTKKGYEDVITDNGRDRIKSLIKNNWVVGYSSEVTELELNEMYAKIQSSYFQDYKKHWQSALSQLSIPKYNSVAAISNQLTVLTAPDSPIYAILEAVKENTLIFTPAEVLKQKYKGKKKPKNKAAKLLAKQAIAEAERQMSNRSVKDIRRYFSKYHELLTPDSKGASQLKHAMGKMSTVFQEITAIHGSVTPQKDAFDIVISRINGSHPPIIMKTSGLPTPVDKWFKDALRNDWDFLLTKAKEFINMRYKDEVLSFYNSKLKDRYPLARSTHAPDIVISDFEEFFKKGGIVDSFYEQYVSKFVALNYNRGHYRFRYIDGSTLPIKNSYLKAMLAVHDIRKNYFNSSGSHVGTNLTYKANYLGRSLATVELHFDNRYIAYEHGPKKAYTIKWPADSSNQSARFNIFNIQANNVLALAEDGDWALFKVFDQLHSKNYTQRSGRKSVTLEYKKSSNKASITLYGSVAQKYSKYNPLNRFKLLGGL